MPTGFADRFPRPRVEPQALAPDAGPGRRGDRRPRYSPAAGVVAVLASRSWVARARGLAGVAGQPRRPDRSEDEQARRRDPGWPPTGPAGGRRWRLWVGNLDERTLTKIDPSPVGHGGTFPLGSRTPTGCRRSGFGPGSRTGRSDSSRQSIPEFGQVTKTIDGAEAMRSGAAASRRRRLGGVTPTRRLRTSIRALASRGGPGGGGRRRRAGSRRCHGLRLWVVNSDSVQTVQRFRSGDVRRNDRKNRRSASTERPTAIARRGAIWVANTGSRTPSPASTRATLFSAGTKASVGDGPVALAVGAGSVWVANAERRNRHAHRRRHKRGGEDDQRSATGLRGSPWREGYVWVSLQLTPSYFRQDGRQVESAGPEQDAADPLRDERRLAHVYVQSGTTGATSRARLASMMAVGAGNARFPRRRAALRIRALYFGESRRAKLLRLR